MVFVSCSHRSFTRLLLSRDGLYISPKKSWIRHNVRRLKLQDDLQDCVWPFFVVMPSRWRYCASPKAAAQVLRVSMLFFFAGRRPRLMVKNRRRGKEGSQRGRQGCGLGQHPFVLLPVVCAVTCDELEIQGFLTEDIRLASSLELDGSTALLFHAELLSRLWVVVVALKLKLQVMFLA